MIHQPKSTFIKGYMEEVITDTALVLKIREEITKFFVQRSHKPFWMVYEDLERDAFLSAEEAKAYGIVDSIGLKGFPRPEGRSIPTDRVDPE